MPLLWPFTSPYLTWTSEIIRYGCCLLTTVLPLTALPHQAGHQTEQPQTENSPVQMGLGLRDSFYPTAITVLNSLQSLLCIYSTNLHR